MHTEDTICAMATPQGGAIGVVRISGKNAITIADKIFVPTGKNTPSLSLRESHTVTFGNIICNDDIIDEVLVTVFRAPHSYTGEDSVEISCHGSSYILQRVMELLIMSGCRSAGPGEFTKRAFLNGKMDLSQAEAVADLIASDSAASHQLAMTQMRGGFKNEIEILRNKLLHITSLLELELDFSDHEDLEFANRQELLKLSKQIEEKIGRLHDSFRLGNVLKNGVPTAIIGETNAGKSTLLNALVGEERAIVSNIHGTTRDVIEDTVNIDGILYRFIDTAGIRDTNDTIEKIGIERTFAKVEQADIILWVIDATCAEEQFKNLAGQILPFSENEQIVILLNKTDLLPDPSFIQELINKLKTLFLTTDKNPKTSSILKTNILPLSSHNIQDINKLRKHLTELTSSYKNKNKSILVTNIRHQEALSNALQSIRRVSSNLLTLPEDLISQDLRECIHHLSEITGEVTSDMTLENIFKHFCIGK